MVLEDVELAYQSASPAPGPSYMAHLVVSYHGAECCHKQQQPHGDAR